MAGANGLLVVGVIGLYTNAIDNDAMRSSDVYVYQCITIQRPIPYLGFAYH
ncbi:hypothetical protein GCM10027592_44200 [Spirosoma flavus]